MQKVVNVVSKMSQAAMKAWETRRKNKLAAGSSSVRKTSKKEMKEKKKTKTVKEVSNEIASDVGFKADEKRDMIVLNGVEAEQMAKKTQKLLDRKAAFDEAKNGNKDLRAISVGKIIEKAKIERFNGGIRLS